MEIDLKNINIKKAHEDLVAKKYSVQELLNAYLKNIEEKNKNLNIYLSIFTETFEKKVVDAQKRIDEGGAGLLTGIPYAVKSIINIKGQKTNSASKILENYISPYNATVIEKLDEENAIPLGYANMDEFACGASGENSAFGSTKNPLDETRVSGGSSSGPAAAVAADMALFSLGTDTGGSIRQPSSFCGLVGVKPNYGRVSRKGSAAMGSSFDQISPITKNLEDNKIILEVISGKDNFDMNVLDNRDFLNDKELKLKKRVAVPRKFLEQIQDKKVLENFESSLSKFREKGYEIVDIDFDNLKLTLPIYYVLMSAEFSTNVSRIDGMRYGKKIDGEDMIDDYFKTRGNGFGEEVKRRIILGTYVLSAGYEDQYYNKAGILREQIRDEFSEKIKDFDAILLPTTPTPAFKMGENEDPIEMYLADIFTVSSSVISNPAISIPSGEIEVEGGNKMPLGLQILVNFEDEKTMYKIAGEFLEK
jgi:aspartyl-tRNA(Asn)/glutamyl-tRNA(Gln) amidotransferase subunit A